ncbi:MAG: carbohydrate-binding domain-containing protein [Ruminococcus sp.]|nr:carbohydrate-binding domain-containing protein [Ruminococcus sp.]
MKNTRRNFIVAMMAVCMLMAGCSESSDSSSAASAKSTSSSGSSKSLISTVSESESETENESVQATTAAATDNTDDEDIAENASETESEDDDGLFTKRDLAQTADTDDAETITVSDGQTIDITEEGVYILTGTAMNCTVRIEVDSEEKIQLVLDGVSITNDDFPAIYVVNADKVFVTTVEGTENELSVTGQFVADGDTNTDAVIFAKDDIVLNGLGTLNITSSYSNGISGHDDMKITGGTYNITSALDAIEANDSILIADGTFNITSSKDGLHCENDDDDTLGYIYILGGTFNIKANSDGIQGTTFVQIDGGTFDISASEGIEGTAIQINDGTISISASDDGVNASRKSTAYDVYFEMNGGSLTVTMSGGDVDCIDANGSIYVNGGTIDLNYPEQGPSESFDYDETAEFNGGTIIINGSEVDSIPQPMMMGGGDRGDMGGGFGGDFGGDMGGDFGGGRGGHGGGDFRGRGMNA